MIGKLKKSFLQSGFDVEVMEGSVTLMLDIWVLARAQALAGIVSTKRSKKEKMWKYTPHTDSDSRAPSHESLLSYLLLWGCVEEAWIKAVRLNHWQILFGLFYLLFVLIFVLLFFFSFFLLFWSQSRIWQIFLSSNREPNLFLTLYLTMPYCTWINCDSASELIPGLLRRFEDNPS